jgi:hypothetical protein
MPKNKFGGNKAKKGKNVKPAKLLVVADQTYNGYGQVIGNLGNGRVSLNILGKNGNEGLAQGIIRGRVRRARFMKDDVVLFEYRTFERTKDEYIIVDITNKYTSDQVKELEYNGEFILQSSSSNNDIIFENDPISDSNSDSDSELDINSKPETSLESESNKKLSEVDKNKLAFIMNKTNKANKTNKINQKKISFDDKCLNDIIIPTEINIDDI